MWNVKSALTYLNKHAHKHSLGRCAEFVRLAVEAGGVKLIHHLSAKDYGSSLERVGFKAVAQVLTHFSPGDVAVIQPIPGHPHGHMAMFNGEIWISDFRQSHGLYPGPTYRKIKPAFTIYRYGMIVAAPPGSTPLHRASTIA